MKRLQDGWVEIKEMNRKGEVIRLNEENGKIHVSRKGGQLGVYGSNTTIADVLNLINNGSKIDNWFLTPFKKWQKEFCKNNIEQYNKLINLDLVYTTPSTGRVNQILN